MHDPTDRASDTSRDSRGENRLPSRNAYGLPGLAAHAEACHHRWAIFGLSRPYWGVGSAIGLVGVRSPPTFSGSSMDVRVSCFSTKRATPKTVSGSGQVTTTRHGFPFRVSAALIPSLAGSLTAYHYTAHSDTV